MDLKDIAFFSNLATAAILLLWLKALNTIVKNKVRIGFEPLKRQLEPIGRTFPAQAGQPSWDLNTRSHSLKHTASVTEA